MTGTIHVEPIKNYNIRDLVQFWLKVAKPIYVWIVPNREPFISPFSFVSDAERGKTDLWREVSAEAIPTIAARFPGKYLCVPDPCSYQYRGEILYVAYRVPPISNEPDLPETPEKS